MRIYCIPRVGSVHRVEHVCNHWGRLSNISPPPDIQHVDLRHLQAVFAGKVHWRHPRNHKPTPGWTHGQLDDILDSADAQMPWEDSVTMNPLTKTLTVKAKPSASPSPSSRTPVIRGDCINAGLHINKRGT
ncbi:hypothetical protein chiPu_0007892 [Chiloscyllium punctatum]|uniref:Uncharacterized protein n=1 Tax=Chiloscyllium punctatum TaxID=137246 RepID=A0A401SGI4_CHIPU|nr:hypothetical protein [Chiloscyllium punctatum]